MRVSKFILSLFGLLSFLCASANAAVGDRYELVTDTAMLVDGDEVIVVCRDYGVTMSSKSAKNHITAVPVSVADGGETAELSDETTLVMTLKKESGYWRLQAEGGCLCASSSGSYVLTIGKESNRNGVDKADIEFDEDGNANIDFRVSAYKRIKYNGTDRFACYYTYGVQPSVQLYRKERNVSVAESMVLDELADNASQVEANASAKVKTVVVHRTFVADGGCYTLCLPFALSAADIADAFKGAAFYGMRSVKAAADSVTFVFSAVQKTEAGVPYVVVPQASAGGDIVNPELHNKVVAATAPRTVRCTADGKVYSFVGTFNSAELPASGSVRFVGDSGRLLVTPNHAAHLRGLRAYFTLPDVLPSVNVGNFGAERLCVMQFGEQTETDVSVPGRDTDGGVGRMFTLSGQPAGVVTKPGIYVQNGRKTVVK